MTIYCSRPVIQTAWIFSLLQSRQTQPIYEGSYFSLVWSLEDICSRVHESFMFKGPWQNSQSSILPLPAVQWSVLPMEE